MKNICDIQGVSKLMVHTLKIGQSYKNKPFLPKSMGSEAYRLDAREHVQNSKHSKNTLWLENHE